MKIVTDVPARKAEASATAERPSGSAVCQTRSRARSERRPHSTIAIDASAKGMPFSNPTCMLVRPKDLIICGCHSDSA